MFNEEYFKSLYPENWENVRDYLVENVPDYIIVNNHREVYQNVDKYAWYGGIVVKTDRNNTYKLGQTVYYQYMDNQYSGLMYYKNGVRVLDRKDVHSEIIAPIDSKPKTQHKPNSNVAGKKRLQPEVRRDSR